MNNLNNFKTKYKSDKVIFKKQINEMEHQLEK